MVISNPEWPALILVVLCPQPRLLNVSALVTIAKVTRRIAHHRDVDMLQLSGRRTQGKGAPKKKVIPKNHGLQFSAEFGVFFLVFFFFFFLKKKKKKSRWGCRYGLDVWLAAGHC